jgi:hypothetical protein
MKFAFLGYGVEQNSVAKSENQRQAMMEDCFAYDTKLQNDGHMVNDGAALQPSRTAKTVRWQNGKVLVTDGPFTETKEQLGGLGVLEARDMSHAVELLLKHPGLKYGATFEIRPINEETLERQATSLAKWRGNVPAGSTEMVKFASLGYINETGSAFKSTSEYDVMMKQCVAFDEERVKNGQWLSGIGLQSARTAKTLRAKAGKVIVTDGPFTKTKEYLGVVVVLALKDLNEAVTLLSKHPALPFGVAMEIRPINEEIDRRWKAKQARFERV